MPITATLDNLTEEDLVKIMTEPKNALVKQYQRLFEMDGVELKFKDNSLTEIAKLAIERETGARGLRTIFEKILGDVMFETPSDDTISAITVTKDCVVNGKKPTISHNIKEPKELEE